MEGCGRGLMKIPYRHLRLKGLRKSMKTLSRDSRSSGRDLNLARESAGVSGEHMW
jgi:hypothetical protein